ncbi:MAG: transposase, partial [Verrucomicrobia bacterium]|nr:transposase [Verrucomicrobiota bacterium]
MARPQHSPTPSRSQAPATPLESRTKSKPEEKHFCRRWTKKIKYPRRIRKSSFKPVESDQFQIGPRNKDKYKLFARKVWPLLAAKREELAQCYEPENGRPGIEPVVLLGVLIFQFLERVPDRQATELVKYHLGWKLALNLKLGAEGFHPTTLVNFRQRLLEAGKSDLAL